MYIMIIRAHKKVISQVHPNAVLVQAKSATVVNKDGSKNTDK